LKYEYPTRHKNDAKHIHVHGPAKQPQTRVAKLRKKQKIPSFRSQAVPVLTAEQIKLLGTVYDRELAAIVGCNINAITKIRMQMGIKAIGKKSN
jgi:hypothetical protein